MRLSTDHVMLLASLLLLVAAGEILLIYYCYFSSFSSNCHLKRIKDLQSLPLRTQSERVHKQSKIDAIQLHNDNVSSFVPNNKNPQSEISSTINTSDDFVLCSLDFSNCSNRTAHDYRMDEMIFQSNQKLDQCPDNQPNLVGELFIPQHNEEHNFKEVCKWYKNITYHDLGFGGSWRPHNCTSLENLAVIIPYRNRSEHLLMLLNHLHDILKKQLATYKIFVVEQFGTDEFNKGRLMNAAFEYVNLSENVDCIVFHDVDMLLENDRNLYRCDPNGPRHLSPAVSSLGYRLPYKELIGGAFAITPIIFKRVNGYSNLYWGWGGEDDDMYYRLQIEKINITRSSATVGRYRMNIHKKRVPMEDKIRYKLVWSATERYKNDGLVQLKKFNCSIRFVKQKFLFTHIMVDVGFH